MSPHRSSRRPAHVTPPALAPPAPFRMSDSRHRFSLPPLRPPRDSVAPFLAKGSAARWLAELAALLANEAVLEAARTLSGAASLREASLRESSTTSRGMSRRIVA